MTKTPFEARYPEIMTDDANVETAERVAEAMCELASRGGEESFRYVCGGVFLLGKVGPISWSTRVAALRALYADQGLEDTEGEAVELRRGATITGSRRLQTRRRGS